MEKTPKKKVLIKYFICIGLQLVLFISELEALNQVAPENIHVIGKVIDQNSKEAIPGVNVVVEGTFHGTVTDIDGMFSIVLEKGKTLIFSSIGYSTQSHKTNRSYLEVTLVEQVENISEVKVLARTNINDIDMRKIAGEIEVVSVQKLSNRPEPNLSMLLQGQVPGLTVTPTGELGTKPKVRIRGTSSFRKGDEANQPLFVLDGMVISAEAFYTLNAEDFEEIKVLKDAAASALYGIKAANGVVEITSKRGFEGKAQVSVRSNTGVTLRGPRGVEMMNSKEKLELERLLKLDLSPGYLYSEEYFKKYYSHDPNLDHLIAQGHLKLDSLRSINTDWFNELIKMSVYQSNSLGVRGGNNKSKYYYSIKYDHQGGRIAGNDLNRFTGRMNLDYTLTPKLFLSLNNSLGYSITNTPYGSSHNPTSLVYNLNPYEQKVDPKTGKAVKLYSYLDRTFDDLMNQYSKKTTSKRITSSINMNWMLSEEMNVSAILGFDYLLGEMLSVVPADAYSQINYKDSEKGEIKKDKNTELNYSANIRINYHKSWYGHNLTLSGNYDYYHTGYDNIGLTGYGIASKVKTAAGINQGLTGSRKTRVRSLKEKYAQLGIGVAMGYSYKSIYDFYGSYKNDASSLLPSDKRRNTAWSVGCGWGISNYPLLMSQNVFSNIRLRASYGYTANLAGIPASATLPTYSYSQEIYAESRILDLNQLYNSDLKPEQTKSTNIGLSFTLLNMLDLDVSAYKRKTEDALLDVAIPASNGYSSMNRNIGILQNSGLEFRLSGDLIDKDDSRWNSSLSLSWNKNKVVELYDGTEYFSGNGETLLPDMQEGKPLDLIYGLQSLGIHSIDGLPRYLSATGQQIDYTHNLRREDFKVLGYATAPYMGFFNNSVRYKNFSLNFDFYFTFGAIATYDRTYVRDLSNADKNAVKGQTKDMWFKPGDENKIYHTVNVPASAYTILDYPSTKTTYKTDYIKLSNLCINYKLPKAIIDKTNGVIRYASLSIQGQNIWKFQRERDKASLRGVEQPIITMGANVTF
ncbi:SusC/RagA family TonB-linked outer membrane protein [Puteibacter caeruleilacunae]|nr:SusC/RagA family TonB-linked outer membrane protein [Puteibacter caeruleilacunae]